MEAEKWEESREFNKKKYAVLSITITDSKTAVQQWNLVELSGS